MSLGLTQGMAPRRAAGAAAPPGTGTVWGEFATQGDFPADDLRAGDSAYSVEDLAWFQWDGDEWMLDRAVWDGSTAGQTIADLPVPATTGAAAKVGTRGFYFGGASWSELVPAFSVATFSLLPASPSNGLIVRVTGEAGISSIVARYDAGAWYALAASCAWPTLPVDGEWYSTGGVVVDTLTNAIAYLTDSGSVIAGGAIWTGARWRFASGTQYKALSGEQTATAMLASAALPPGQTSMISNP